MGTNDILLRQSVGRLMSARAMQYMASYSLGGALCGSPVASSRRKCGVLHILFVVRRGASSARGIRRARGVV